MSNTLLTKEINIRDPFILPFNGKYYMYRCEGKNGVSCYTSIDLDEWEGPFPVLNPTNPDYAGAYFYAPEVHYLNGKFYLISSCKSARNNVEMISIYKADTPLGPFVTHGEQITPKDHGAIDGTLYTENGTTFLIFSGVFTSEPDGIGKMMIAPLNNDLTMLTDKPQVLFKANDPVWTDDRVCEAPFLFKRDGDLFMIWSNYADHYYVEAIAKSTTGSIYGPWEHAEKPIYQKGLNSAFKFDGGHGMVFVGFDGKTRLTLHAPNTIFLPKEEAAVVGPEHPLIMELDLTKDIPTLKF